MTKIISTIGPVTLNLPTLEYFANNNVEIARLNLSHGDPQWHLEAANLIKQTPLRILLDLSGPKIRLGEVQENVSVISQQIVNLEMQKPGQFYPYKNSGGELVFPYHFPLHEHLAIGSTILIDDGKMEWHVTEVNENGLKCEVIFGGVVSSRKGLNTPGSDLRVSFLTDRDKLMLDALLVQVRPKFLACSFVKTGENMQELKKLVSQMLQDAGVRDYMPLFCPKIEMGEAIENLESIVQESDLIMVARGDLALETLPVHVQVPFLQDYIALVCQKNNKPFIVATQMLESMISAPVPTRAEVSDIYRAVAINQANYIMLSAETASGSYPRQCVDVMSDMIEMVEKKSIISTKQNLDFKVFEKIVS